MADLKEQVLELLEGVGEHAEGSFATSGPIVNPPTPGIFVHGFGKLGLPLPERDAVALSKICKQSPFGKGSKTFVDESVRKSWELDPSQFEVRNPAWNICVAETLKRVGKELGLLNGLSSMRAELYKMLLYEKGAFFDKHRDSEKTAGMFGTLVIALPSSHDGGEVEAKFDGKRIVLQTAQFSDYEYRYLAWYADVEHAVRPIKSGFRLVLTYNLVQSASNVPVSPFSSCDATARLGALFRLWNDHLLKKHSNPTRLMAYVLQHRYTEANLRLHHLKGQDRAKAEIVREACANHGIDFYLANLEYLKTGGCEGSGYEDEDEDDEDEDVGFHLIDEILYTETYLRAVFRLDGRKFAEQVTINESDIIQDDAFEREPDDEDYNGFTGNECVSATHFFRDSCFVIIPRQYRIEVFQPWDGGVSDVSLWLECLIEDYEANPRDLTSRDNLMELCAFEDKRNIDGRVLSLVIKGAMLLEIPHLFEKAVTLAAGTLPFAVFHEIGKRLRSPGLLAWQNGLNLAVDPYSKIHGRCKALKNLVVGYESSSATATGTVDGDLEELQKWRQQKIESVLGDDRNIYMEDAAILVELTCEYGNSFLFQIVLPMVKRHLSKTTFLVSFLVNLHQASESAQIKEDIVCNVFRDILCNVVPHMQIGSEAEAAYEKLHKRQRRTVSGYYDERRQTSESASPFVKVEDVVTLICKCVSLGLEVEIEQIFAQITLQAANMEVAWFTTQLFPALKNLLATLMGKKSALDSPSYRLFFRHIMSSYVRRSKIGPKPEPPRDWTCARVGCGCQNCLVLDEFLSDPHRMAGRFTMAQTGRHHLASRIRSMHQVSTEADGNTYTLIVTKSHEAWKPLLKQWKSKYAELKRKIDAIGSAAHLLEVLGENYEDILQRPTAPAPLSRPPARASLATTAMAPNRRIPSASATATPNKGIPTLSSGATSKPSTDGVSKLSGSRIQVIDLSGE